MEFLSRFGLQIFLGLVLIALLWMVIYHKIISHAHQMARESFWKQYSQDLLHLRQVNLKLQATNDNLMSAICSLINTGKIPIVKMRAYLDKKAENAPLTMEGGLENSDLDENENRPAEAERSQQTTTSK